MRQKPSRLVLAAALVLCIGCSPEPENLTELELNNNTENNMASDHSRDAPRDHFGADVLSRYCSDCHIAPKAQTKTASEWPVIIQRMQTYRSRQAMPILNDAEINEITTYLIKHSSIEPSWN